MYTFCIHVIATSAHSSAHILTAFTTCIGSKLRPASSVLNGVSLRPPGAARFMRSSQHS